MSRTRKKNPPSDDDLPPISDVLDPFIEKLNDHAYQARFLLTLELNKIEAAHQKYEQPMIFLRTLDEFGVVECYRINPTYRGKVPNPPEFISRKDGLAVIEHLSDENIVKRLAVMITVGGLEEFFFRALPQDEFERTTPPFRKTFDEYGLPVEYQMNWPVEHMDEER